MNNNIGEARRSYELKEGRFTQEDAARYFGVGTSTYKGWEQGRGKLNGEILCRIADKYECSVDYLLMRTDVPDFSPVQQLSRQEVALLDLFYATDDRGRDTIMTIAEQQAGDRAQARARLSRAA